MSVAFALQDSGPRQQQTGRGPLPAEYYNLTVPAGGSCTLLLCAGASLADNLHGPFPRLQVDPPPPCTGIATAHLRACLTVSTVPDPGNDFCLCARRPITAAAPSCGWAHELWGARCADTLLDEQVGRLLFSADNSQLATLAARLHNTHSTCLLVWPLQQWACISCWLQSYNRASLDGDDQVLTHGCLVAGGSLEMAF